MLHSLSALQTFGSWMWDCLGLYLLGETEHVKNEGNEATGCLTFLCMWVWSCLKMTQWVCLTFWCMWVDHACQWFNGLFDILCMWSDHGWKWFDGGVLTFVLHVRDPTLISSYGLFDIFVHVSDMLEIEATNYSCVWLFLACKWACLYFTLLKYQQKVSSVYGRAFYHNFSSAKG